MLNSRTHNWIALPLVAGLLAGSIAIGHAATAPRKGGLTPAARGRSATLRAGIPPEAFGSPALSPDSTRLAWIADEGDGANLYVGARNRAGKRKLTSYKFTPANDVLPGPPLLWSPDGRSIAYFEYSHSARKALSSSRAVVVPADGSDGPVRLTMQGSDWNTRPGRWVDKHTLRFKGLRTASLTGGEDTWMFDLLTGIAQTESAYVAVQQAARAAADSAARATAAPNAAASKASHGAH